MAHEGSAARASLPPERQARYGWAARLVTGGRVLDAGCGAGWGTAALAEHAREAMGIDFSPAAIADARQAHGDQADFREGDIRDLSFDDGEFDAVICFETIAHVADAEQALDELRRVLRHRGLLLVSSPNRGIYPPGNPLHPNEMTSQGFEDLLRARFANVAVYRQQTYFASLLGTEAVLAHDDPKIPIGAYVTKSSGGPPGSELYAVAVATDGRLPPEPAYVALGENVDYDAQRRLIEMWQERAVNAEAEALALRKEIHAMGEGHRPE